MRAGRTLGRLVVEVASFLATVFVAMVDRSGRVVWKFHRIGPGSASIAVGFVFVTVGWMLGWALVFPQQYTGIAILLGILTTAVGTWRQWSSTPSRTPARTQHGSQPPSQAGDPNAGQGPEFLSDVPDIDFDDVGGMADLKAELTDRVIDPLDNPEQYERYGLSVETGFLLYGPPGTGKTYISKALAGELGVNYIEVKAGDLVSEWVGAGPQNVQRMFEEARAAQPCLVFVDELDALTPARGGANQHQDQQQMVNQFLEELSTLHESDADVVFVAATNRPDQIDDAMLRPGRLSQKIEVPPPDAEGRLAVLDAHLDAPVDWVDLDGHRIAQLTDGFTAADMEQVAAEAARNAMRRDDAVRQQDIEVGIEAVGNTQTADSRL